MKGWKNGAAGENLLRTGMGCFVFATGATLVNVLLLPFARTYYGQGIGGVLIAFVLALAAYGAAERLLMRINEHTLAEIRKAAVPACLTVLFLVQIVLGYLMEYTPAGDNFMIYNGSALLAKEGCFDQEPGFELYLSRFSNQWGFLLFFTAMWKILGAFGLESIFVPMVIVQAVVYIPGILSALSIARRRGGVRTELLLLLMLMTCLPLYLAAGVLYTDTFSLPFVIMALDLALRVLDETDTKRRLRLCALCGLVVTLGGMIKMTVAIVFIAAAITWLLALGFRRTLPCIVLCCAIMAAGSGAVRGILFSGPIDSKMHEQHNTPIVHWIMMSIPSSDNPYGGYSGEYGLTWEMMEAGATHEEVMDSILSRMKDKIYTLRYPNRLVMAALRKNAAAFGDGTFGMTEMLDDKPVRRNAVSEIVLGNGEHYKLYQSIASGIYFAQMLLAVLACIRDIQKRDLSMAMGYVAGFGILLFLMIWEARSRYFFGFVPVILVLASLCIEQKSEKTL